MKSMVIATVMAHDIYIDIKPLSEKVDCCCRSKCVIFDKLCNIHQNALHKNDKRSRVKCDGYTCDYRIKIKEYCYFCNQHYYLNKCSSTFCSKSFFM